MELYGLSTLQACHLPCEQQLFSASGFCRIVPAVVSWLGQNDCRLSPLWMPRSAYVTHRMGASLRLLLLSRAAAAGRGGPSARTGVVRAVRLRSGDREPLAAT